ncbi:MAG: hypothetical protein ACLUIQ_11610 [Dialister invisus]
MDAIKAPGAGTHGRLPKPQGLNYYAALRPGSRLQRRAFWQAWRAGFARAAAAGSVGAGEKPHSTLLLAAKWMMSMCAPLSCMARRWRAFGGGPWGGNFAARVLEAERNPGSGLADVKMPGPGGGRMDG